MTNYYIYILNKVYTSVNEQSARNNREHLENRYKETLDELSRYEDSLKLFQQKYGVYDIETQTSAAIKATAELKSQILLKEVEVGVKKKIYGNNSEEIRILSSELEQLNKKVEEMFDGNNDQTITSVFIPFKKAPQLGLQYIRLYRNVKIYNELIKVIVPMLEQARLQEKRESPSIVIVDKATMPEKKGRPKRSVYVIGIFFGLLTISSIYIFLSEHLHNVKIHDPLRFQQLTLFSKVLKGDIRNIFSKKSKS
jgi:tyrosine-protein kinase Etk/Wzc